MSVLTYPAIAYGWPCRCLSTIFLEFNRTGAQRIEPRVGVDLRPMLAAPASGDPYARAAPLWPNFGQLLVSSAFYGLLIWGLGAWRSAARRHRRVDRPCPACGYELAATPEGLPCPECGTGSNGGEGPRRGDG